MRFKWEYNSLSEFLCWRNYLEANFLKVSYYVKFKNKIKLKKKKKKKVSSFMVQNLKQLVSYGLIFIGESSLI